MWQPEALLFKPEGATYYRLRLLPRSISLSVVDHRCDDGPHPALACDHPRYVVVRRERQEGPACLALQLRMSREGLLDFGSKGEHLV